MNSGYFIVYGIMAFAGLCFGWFFKKNNPFMMFIGCWLFAGLLDQMIAVDHVKITLPFIFGFLLQTWKPIYEKIRS